MSGLAFDQGACPGFPIWITLFQTDAEKNLKTVLRLPIDSDILTVILDYAYTNCVPQLTATGINDLLCFCSVIASSSHDN